MPDQGLFAPVTVDGCIPLGYGSGGASGGYSTSHTGPEVVSPFGGLPTGLARTLNRGFARPLAMGFGIGDPESSKYQDFMDQLSRSEGPLADFITQGRSFLPTVVPDAQKVGADIASRAPALYNQLQGQISSLLDKLPNFQRLAGEQTGLAQGAAKEAFDPYASNSLFQNELKNTLSASRASAGGRGLLDAGTTQAQEEGLTSNLASQFAQNQFSNQQAALGGARSALGADVGLAGAGIDPASAALGALQPYAEALSAKFGIPMSALSSVFSMLTGTQAPSSQLLSQTAPTVAQHGKSKGFQQSASGGL